MVVKNFLAKKFGVVLLVLCFITTFLNAGLAIIFNDVAYTGNKYAGGYDANAKFVISLNSDYNNSDDILKVDLLEDEVRNPKNRDDVIKKLIKEYLIERYTVILHKDLSARKFMPLNDTKAKKSIYISPRVSKVALTGIVRTADGKDSYTKAYRDFMTVDKEEHDKLVASGTTRSVIFLSEPYKNPMNEKEWIVRVKFVYKEPDTDSLKDAKQEIYNIRMNVVFGNVSYGLLLSPEAMNYYYPSSVFLFTVGWLEKNLEK